MAFIYEEYIKAVDQRDIKVSDTLKCFGRNVVLTLANHHNKDEIIKKIDGYILSLKKDISTTKYALNDNMIKGRKTRFKRTIKRLDEEATQLNLSLKQLEEEYTMYKQLKEEVKEDKYNDIIK